MENSSLEVRKQQELDMAYIEADNIIMKKYMNNLSSYEIKTLDSELQAVDLNRVFRLNKIEKLVYDADENNLEKLMNVYNAVGLSGGSIINIAISDGNRVDYYIGTRSDDMNGVATCQDVLVSSFTGNFQGSTMSLQKKGEMQECMNRLFDENDNRPVTVVTGIPGYRNENNKENRKFVQGIEKVIDSMKGKAFAFVTISTPISSDMIYEIKQGYENLYTQFSPFAMSQLSYGQSESDSVAETITDGVTKTLGVSLSNTISNSTTNTKGVSKSVSSSKAFNIGGFGGIAISGEKKNGANIGMNIGGSFSRTNTTGDNYSQSIQSGSAQGQSISQTDASSQSVGNTNTYTDTSSRSLQINIENKSVKNLLEKIDGMLKRIEDSADLGLWNTSTYCIAENSQTSKVVASQLESICRGDKTTIENFAIDTWSDSIKSGKVKQYLKRMVHPVLLVEGSKQSFEVNPSSIISGKELVLEAGLPQKSISGLAVSEMASFARNVVCEEETIGEKISLGQIYHMGGVENTKVEIDVESMSAHTLVTGSTGSGKSNTVYSILSELKKKQVGFLIIEPAKGEYKHIFGNEKDVNVYGTNEKYNELLKINPFSFPEGIHILEHVDRLVEIFNVCWPMYAAMPAVLKDAILQAYQKCGWNLETSENIYQKEYFPTFKDIQKQIIGVINSSAYSEELKGNYIGSLATRVNSLTNGINGQIFVTDEVTGEKLFDENTIVDLSRVGSSEVKSLIMGILVMKINEHRMATANGRMNQKLKHVTVLEEAHNLLRNTQGKISSSEGGGDIAGKSVEMLSNAIAEMRTYGEGFIIVDQSPNAIDISAIRNTNTKIIMRLPEESDRHQAGKSAAMKENQISELAKLPKGVAVVYQNNWLDPVLCKINKANVVEQVYEYCHKKTTNDNEKNVRKMITQLLIGNRVDECLEISPNVIRHGIEYLNISTESKIIILNVLERMENDEEPGILKENSFVNLSKLVCEVIQYDSMKDILSNVGEVEDVQKIIHEGLKNKLGQLSKESEYAIAQCVIRNMVEEDKGKIELYARWKEYSLQQRKYFFGVI